jgi:predicted amidohydrolase
MDDDTVLIGCAVIFKGEGKQRKWLITQKKEDSDWELPRQKARKKSESTAKAAGRLAGEQLGMSARVLEEAGRAGGVTTINGETKPQRTLYYLMVLRSQDGEVIGYYDHAWLPYASAVRKLSAKRDRKMIKAAREELKAWQKREEEKRKRNKK